MKVQSYLFFDGRCDEALEFYGSALGAKVDRLMRFRDNPDPQPQSEGCAGAMPAPDKVMHASFRVGETELMASDGRCEGKPEFKGFSLTLDAKDLPEAERLMTTLAQGGQVCMPLAATFFSPGFGMVADRFGVSWMVIVHPV